MDRIRSFFRFFKPERFEPGHVSALFERNLPVSFSFHTFAIDGSEYYIQVHFLFFSPMMNDRLDVVGWPVHDIHVLASSPCGLKNHAVHVKGQLRVTQVVDQWLLVGSHVSSSLQENPSYPRSICFFIDSQAENA